MKKNIPSYLNLELLSAPSSDENSDNLILCHVEHDEHGNKIRAIPFKVNSSGYLSLDFSQVVHFTA